MGGVKTLRKLLSPHPAHKPPRPRGGSKSRIDQPVLGANANANIVASDISLEKSGRGWVQRYIGFPSVCNIDNFGVLGVKRRVGEITRNGEGDERLNTVCLKGQKAYCLQRFGEKKIYHTTNQPSVIIETKSYSR